MCSLPSWIQTIANVAIIATMIIYGFQLKAMRDQLAASQSASRSQNLLALIQFLQQPEFIEARRVLMSLAGTGSEKWSEEEKMKAERAIANYDIVAIMLRDGGIPSALEKIVDSWGHSIRKCYEVAAPYIAQKRIERGENYWDDFPWLAERAIEHGIESRGGRS